MPDLAKLRATQKKLIGEVAERQRQRARDAAAIAEINRPVEDSERKARLVDERADLHLAVDELQKRLDKIEIAIAKELKISGEEAISKRACIDGATTSLVLKLVLTDCRENGGWTGGVNAADRTEEHADDCGDKSSQAELYYGYIHGLPGFYPANPPGVGSHEGINDGTAILTKPAGAKLDPWEWGLDLSQADSFVSACARRGYSIRRPYGNEPWHFNLTSDPRPQLRKHGLIG